jgi:hypothetical protein
MDNDLDACTLRTVNDEQCPAAESTAAASTVTTEDLDPLPSFLRYQQPSSGSSGHVARSRYPLGTLYCTNINRLLSIERVLHKLQMEGKKMSHIHRQLLCHSLSWCEREKRVTDITGQTKAPVLSTVNTDC